MLSYGNAAHIVFLDQACRVVAKDTFGWIPELDTALEGAVVVTQVMAAEAPTQALQLFVQHLCQLGKPDGGVSKAGHTLHSSDPTP